MVAVLGLVTTKTSQVEPEALVAERLRQAAAMIGTDRLAVSPQCGFASVDTGNPVTPEVQEAKLRLVVALARDIWGEG